MSYVIRESAAAYGARVRPWTVDEYYRAARKGLFRPDEKLELIRGEVIQKVSPQLSPHAACIHLAVDVLERAFPGKHIRIQTPLRLDHLSEPEPDLCVVRGDSRDYMERHPGAEDVFLVVEVSDSTLKMDRGRKGPLYAEFDIPEYWIVNLVKHQIEVYGSPRRADGDKASYATSQIVTRDQDFEAFGKTFHASDLLP